MRLQSLLAPVFAAVITATAAQAAFWQWSKTSANNATADASINWSEGMSPSSVNDSARAMMARAAEYRDDISGSITAGGTSTAYTVVTNQGLASTPNDGQLISFTVNTTSGNNATLTVDGGNTYPLKTGTDIPVTSGTLIAGTPYTAKFQASTSSWMLRNFYGNPFAVPLGGMLPYTGDTAPNSSFVLPYGQCISRSTYSAYFSQVGTRFGVCDGSTTFAVPDVRGRSLFVKDDLGGTAANRLVADVTGGITAALGQTIGGSGGNALSTMLQTNLPSVNFAVSIPAGQGSHSHSVSNLFSSANQTSAGPNPSGGAAFTGTTAAATLPAMTGTAASGGSSTAFNNLPPLFVLGCILRVI